ERSRGGRGGLWGGRLWQARVDLGGFVARFSCAAVTHCRCTWEVAHAIFWTANLVLVPIHAPSHSKSAARNPCPFPSSPRSPRGALCRQGPPRKLPRRRLAKRRDAAAAGH